MQIATIAIILFFVLPSPFFQTKYNVHAINATIVFRPPESAIKYKMNNNDNSENIRRNIFFLYNANHDANTPENIINAVKIFALPVSSVPRRSPSTTFRFPKRYRGLWYIINIPRATAATTYAITVNSKVFLLDIAIVQENVRIKITNIWYKVVNTLSFINRAEHNAYSRNTKYHLLKFNLYDRGFSKKCKVAVPRKASKKSELMLVGKSVS